MTIIAIMQPYFLPYIGYWQLINAVDTFVIYDDTNFMNKSYINRNSILLNQNFYRFTLELLEASQNKLINEIEIGNNLLKIIRTIEMSYKKAPYFSIVFPIIKDIFNNKEKNLAKFIGYSLIKISNYLEIDTKFIYSSNVEKNNELKAQNKLINICKILKAKNYINAIGGQKLYDKDSFLNNEINLNFLKTNFIEYKQFSNKFIPNLSIIDILMFNDKSTIKDMLNSYELI